MNLSDIQLWDIIAETNFYANTVTKTVPVMTVQYVGAEASGTVIVTVTTGDVTFQHGDLASEAVDGTINSDDDPGVIDVSDAAANTMGGVVDLINGSDNWRAILHGCRRSDASAGLLFTLSEKQAKVAAGIELAADETVGEWKIGRSITNRKFNTVAGSDGLGDLTDVNHQNSLDFWRFEATFTNTSATYIYDMHDISEDATTEKLIATLEGGATTVAAEYAFTVDQGRAIQVPIGHRIFVQVDNSHAMAITELVIHGHTAKRFA